MKLLERAKKQAASSKPKIKGKVFPIRFIPDPFTGESMNIGVGFIEENGHVHTKLLDSFHRLKCLYDNRITEVDMKYTLQVLEATIPPEFPEKTDYIESPSINIHYGEPVFAAGISVKAILSRMYNDLVTLAVPFPEDKPSRMAGLDTAAVRKAVISEIRERIPMRINSILPESSQFQVDDDEGRQHSLDIPIRGKDMLGTIISACQSEIIVRQNLLEANMDLHLARQKYRNDRMGCFVMRDDNMDERRKRQIDNAIDRLEWKIRTQGVHLDVEFTASSMAEKILEWSDIN